MNETTKNSLNFDPIETTEALIGKRRDDCDVESVEDTHFGITWQDFIKIVKAYGFKCGFCQKFTGTGWSEECVEEEIIFFHEEKGLILYAESFDGNSVNSANVYGEVKLNDGKLEKSQWDALNGCSNAGNENGTMHFHVDVRKGFHFHLDAISEAFEFSTSWSKVPFLWFLNYMDTEDKDYNYEKINKQKIAACTPEVRKIIFG